MCWSGAWETKDLVRKTLRRFLDGDASDGKVLRQEAFGKGEHLTIERDE